MNYNNLLNKLVPSQSMRSVMEDSSAINLSIGAPDLSPSEHLIHILNEYTKKKHFRYFDPKGSIEARTNLNNFLNLKSHNPSEQISVISGSKFGIYNALKCILNRGDKVGLFPPYWLGYSAINTLHEFRPVYFEPIINNCNVDYNINDIVKIIDQSKIKCLIINTPNNPTGQIFSVNKLFKIIEYCSCNNIWVIIDEVYKDLVYSKYYNIDVNIFRNVIRIGSLSKSFSIPSIRAAYVFGSEEFIKRFNLLNQHTLTCTNSLANFVFESIEIDKFKSYSEKCAKIYNRRTSAVINKLQLKNYKCIVPQSSFYVFVSTDNHFSSGLEASRILEKRGVLVTPGIHYGGDFKHYIRLSATVDMNILMNTMDKF